MGGAGGATRAVSDGSFSMSKARTVATAPASAEQLMWLSLRRRMPSRSPRVISATKVPFPCLKSTRTGTCGDASSSSRSASVRNSFSSGQPAASGVLLTVSQPECVGLVRSADCATAFPVRSVAKGARSGRRRRGTIEKGVESNSEFSLVDAATQNPSIQGMSHQDRHS